MTLPSNSGLPPVPYDIASRRKLAARRLNENLKLLASSLNTVALTILGAAFLLPTISGQAVATPTIWIMIAAGLHLLAQAVLRLIQSED